MARLVAATGVLAVALAAVTFAFTSSGSPSSGVYGRALLGGPCPVSLERPVACSEHPIRATITVMRGGGRVATMRAGRAGRFRTALAPGKYRLVPRPVGSAYAAPLKVQVPDGSFLRVTVRYRSRNR